MAMPTTTDSKTSAERLAATIKAALRRAIDPLDHRLSRHSEHLARLETRIARIEREKDRK
jgi:hypothetical protein